ncbi:MAG: hypothetical protein ABIK90_07340 [candidate division WOR-3 bacterium]
MSQAVRNYDGKICPSLYSLLREQGAALSKEQKEAYFVLYQQWLKSLMAGGEVPVSDAIAIRNVLIQEIADGQYRALTVDGASMYLPHLRVRLTKNGFLVTNLTEMNKGLKGLRSVLQEIGISAERIAGAERAIFEEYERNQAMRV